MLGLVIARLILAPPLLAIAAWFIAWRRARPDLAPRWLVVKLVALPVSIALAAVSTAASYPPTALVMMVLADVVAIAIALRLWVERRPIPLTLVEAAHEARRLAGAASDLADAAERKAGPRA